MSVKAIPKYFLIVHINQFHRIAYPVQIKASCLTAFEDIIMGRENENVERGRNNGQGTRNPNDERSGAETVRQVEQRNPSIIREALDWLVEKFNPSKKSEQELVQREQALQERLNRMKQEHETELEKLRLDAAEKNKKAEHQAQLRKQKLDEDLRKQKIDIKLAEEERKLKLKEQQKTFEEASKLHQEEIKKQSEELESKKQRMKQEVELEKERIQSERNERFEKLNVILNYRGAPDNAKKFNDWCGQPD